MTEDERSRREANYREMSQEYLARRLAFAEARMDRLCDEISKLVTAYDDFQKHVPGIEAYMHRQSEEAKNESR